MLGFQKKINKNLENGQFPSQEQPDLQPHPQELSEPQQEIALEQARRREEEAKDRLLEEQHKQQSQQAQTQAQPQQQIIDQPKSEIYKKVESVLEQDLEQALQVMDQATQAQFIQEGEITASKIEQLITQAKTKARVVLDLIKKWLKMIPHVNKLFLEQQSKIKTDEIMKIVQQEKNNQMEIK